MNYALVKEGLMLPQKPTELWGRIAVCHEEILGIKYVTKKKINKCMTEI